MWMSDLSKVSFKCKMNKLQEIRFVKLFSNDLLQLWNTFVCFYANSGTPVAKWDRKSLKPCSKTPTMYTKCYVKLVRIVYWIFRPERIRSEQSALVSLQKKYVIIFSVFFLKRARFLFKLIIMCAINMCKRLWVGFTRHSCRTRRRQGALVG